MRRSSEILEAAYALIENPKHWGRGYYHKANKYNHRYCSIGALRIADHGNARQHSNDTRYAEWLRDDDILVPAYENINAHDVTQMNDDSEHQTVLELFRKAIRRAKANEAISVEIPSAPIAETAEVVEPDTVAV